MVDVKIKADNHRDASNLEDFQELSKDLDKSLTEYRPGYDGKLDGLTGRLVELSYQKFFTRIMDLVQPSSPDIRDYDCLDIDLKKLYESLSDWRKGAVFLSILAFSGLTVILSYLSLKNPIIWVLVLFYLILLPSIPITAFLAFANKPREKHMAEEITSSLSQSDVETVGAFIGSFHAPKVKAELESQGLEIEIIPPNGLAKITFLPYSFVVYVISKVKRTFSFIFQ